jgi:hypothetical protein
MLRLWLVGAARTVKTGLVGLHVRIPKALLDDLLVRRDHLRKKAPMASLSDAVRETLEDGLRGTR